MSIYLKVLLLCLSAPFLLSLWPPLGFWRHRKALFGVLLPVFLIYSAWDIWAVAKGHWWFNKAAVGRLNFFGLPLEEYFFFIVIPFVSLFTWEAVKYIFKNFRGKR